MDGILVRRRRTGGGKELSVMHRAANRLDVPEQCCGLSLPTLTRRIGMLSVVSTEAPLDYARAPPFGPLRSRRRIGPKGGSANCANCANPQLRPPAGDHVGPRKPRKPPKPCRADAGGGSRVAEIAEIAEIEVLQAPLTL